MMNVRKSELLVGPLFVNRAPAVIRTKQQIHLQDFRKFTRKLRLLPKIKILLLYNTKLNDKQNEFIIFPAWLPTSRAIS